MAFFLDVFMYQPYLFSCHFMRGIVQATVGGESCAKM